MHDVRRRIGLYLAISGRLDSAIRRPFLTKTKVPGLNPISAVFFYYSQVLSRNTILSDIFYSIKSEVLVDINIVYTTQ